MQIDECGMRIVRCAGAQARRAECRRGKRQSSVAQVKADNQETGIEKYQDNKQHKE
jgi:hypothetical protein